MKFPVSLLRDFVETTLSAEELGDLLTMAGFELEGIEEVEGDAVLDIKVMSNRGDGLSVFGLAREVLAKDARAQATELYVRAVARFARPAEPSGPQVRIETPDCTRYAARCFENVRPGSSPEWMQKRLRQAGMRPLGIYVDLTNYVMLELGQPLHAFDQDRLAGGEIVVRTARTGEKLTTLNGVEHELRPDQMMICDGEKPVAAAGIMGGLESEVTESTTRILLESAHFVNTSVRRTRKQMGLSTEASYRFERSVDPDGVVAALNRFAELLAQCQGQATEVPGLTDLYPTPPKSTVLKVRSARAEKLLGMPVTPAEIEGYLRRLGFAVKPVEDGFEVASPSWRPDIVREEDLIEEIGRVHGFDRIPEALPRGKTVQGGLSADLARVDALRDRLMALGFDQIMSHTLRMAHPLDAGHERIGPRNPGSPDIALLRNSTWPSLADAARRNGGQDVHLFEIGKCFWHRPDGYAEGRFLGILSQGLLWPPNRANEPVPSADFFSMKGVLAAIAPGVDIALPHEADPRLHPTRQAILPGLGVFGQIHPDFAEKVGLPETTVLAEIDVDAWLERVRAEISYSPISRNPSVRRDIAILVNKNLPYRQIENAVELAAGDVLEKQWLFDVYEGKGVPEGKHSLAIAIQLRKFGENFTDEEANQVRGKVVAALEALGATWRG